MGVYFQHICKKCANIEAKKVGARKKLLKKRSCRSCKEEKFLSAFKGQKQTCKICIKNIAKKNISSSYQPCFRCQKPVQGHNRCKRCTILLCNGEEYCLTCIKSYEEETIINRETKEKGR
jgi:hypothetical protein